MTSIEGIAALGRLGILTGASAGLLLGTSEACWLAARGDGVGELGLLWWAPLAYALCMAPFGLVATSMGAAVRAPAERVLGRRLPGLGQPGFAFGACLFVGVVAFGRWRYYLDLGSVGGEPVPGKLTVGMIALLGGALAWAVAWGIAKGFGMARTGLVCLLLAVLAAAGVPVVVGPARSNPTSDEAAAQPSATAPSRGANAPDVILIVADTLRADVLTLDQPGAPARTPALEALAGDGVTFLEFCAQSSWTKPGFASLLTGLQPRSHGATNQDASLPEQAVTLAEVFAAHGYYTRGYSNTNPNSSSVANFDQGFLEFADLSPSHAWLGAPWSATRLSLYDRVIDRLAYRVRGVRVHHFYEPADAYTASVLAWLRSWKAQADRPLFLMLHYMDPHDPYLGGRLQGRPILLGRDRERPAHAPRAAMLEDYVGDIEFMDRHLGRLFAGLRELGLYDDAIVAFTSDHGEEIFEHDDWGHGDSLYGEVLRIPLVLKLPGGAGAGRRSTRMGRQIDLAPTLLSLAGLPVPEAMAGLPLVLDDGRILAGEDRPCVSSLSIRGNELDGLRTGDASLIKAARTSQARIAPLELYDLSTDPGERENLAHTGDPREARLAEALERQVREAESVALEAERMDVDPEVESRLRALGYLD